MKGKKNINGRRFIHELLGLFDYKTFKRTLTKQLRMNDGDFVAILGSHDFEVRSRAARSNVADQVGAIRGEIHMIPGSDRSP